MAVIHYARTGEFWRRGEKYDFLDASRDVTGVDWRVIQPDANHTWLTEGMEAEFEEFMPLAVRNSDSVNDQSVFQQFTLGISTNRDTFVYGFGVDAVEKKMSKFCVSYNSEVHKYSRQAPSITVDNFVSYDSIKWSRNLKRHLRNGDILEFDSQMIQPALYRPFSRMYLYFTDIAVDEPASNSEFFPKDSDAGTKNRVICMTDKGSEKPFMALMTDRIADLHVVGAGSGAQCFPFYTYAEDGSQRRENITDWALAQFRSHYADDSIDKWAIFHFVYALLHHPTYREKYAANLRRSLPRLPFAPDFWSFAQAGARLAELHVNYEQQPEYPLEWVENRDAPMDFRVEKMKLARDKNSLQYNNFLTLAGIPPAVFDYKLGNRCALEWVIDRYRVTTDKRSGIVNDPNAYADDPRYIVELIGKVVTVSVETVAIVAGLPGLGV